MTINYPHAIFQFFEHLPKTWGYFFPQKLGKKAYHGPPLAPTGPLSYFTFFCKNWAHPPPDFIGGSAI